MSNRYEVPYETGFLVVLYRLACVWRLRPEMEQYFGIRKSKLSSILKTFANALHAFCVPYLNDVTIHQPRFAYYAQIVTAKADGLMTDVWALIDGTLRKTC